MEQTCIIIKPDSVKRNLVGEIIRRYERKGLQIVAMQMLTASRELAQAHYEDLKDSAFFDELVDFMTSGPVVVMVLAGENAIRAARHLNGATNPLEAAPGTIRGDYGLQISENVVHASDTPAAAAREIALWFPKA